jgi:hypothetical protein
MRATYAAVPILRPTMLFVRESWCPRVQKYLRGTFGIGLWHSVMLWYLEAGGQVERLWVPTAFCNFMHDVVRPG